MVARSYQKSINELVRILDVCGSFCRRQRRPPDAAGSGRQCRRRTCRVPLDHRERDVALIADEPVDAAGALSRNGALPDLAVDVCRRRRRPRSSRCCAACRISARSSVSTCGLDCAPRRRARDRTGPVTSDGACQLPESTTDAASAMPSGLTRTSPVPIMSAASMPAPAGCPISPAKVAADRQLPAADPEVLARLGQVTPRSESAPGRRRRRSSRRARSPSGRTACAEAGHRRIIAEAAPVHRVADGHGTGSPGDSCPPTGSRPTRRS